MSQNEHAQKNCNKISDNILVETRHSSIQTVTGKKCVIKDLNRKSIRENLD